MRAKDYSSDTIRIPALDCLHYLKKRCLKELGSARPPECLLLKKRVKWARRLSRSLDELKRLRPPASRERVLKRCGDVFRENFLEMEAIKCELTSESPGNLGDCSHFHQKICLLILPDCPGRCTDYLRGPGDEEFVS